MGVAAVTLAVAACGVDAVEDPVVAGLPADFEFEGIELPELDIENLRAEIAGTVFEAQPWNDTWVGRVTDDAFIGIRIDGHTDDAGEIVAYLCDDDELALLLEGEHRDGGAVLADDAAELELELAAAAITGSVTLDGEEPVTFTAEPARGSAGVYVVEEEKDDVDAWAGWVVLTDGAVRGSTVRCFRNPWTGEKICRRLN
jgi:hypothetical protein